MTLTRQGFWYLRHGQTDWNINNLAQGRTDIPLNETGISQAHAAAGLLRGRGIRSIVSSPLGRARQTAEIAASATGSSVDIEPELVEVNFGEREGQMMLAPWFDDWVAETSTPAGGESFAAMRDRAVRAVDRALATHQAPVLIVAHGALLRGLRSAMGLTPNLRAANGIPLFCEPVGADAWQIEPAIADAHPL